MKSDFNVLEWKDTLREQSLNGLDASTKVIEFLRSKIYPKLSDDEMDKFIIAIADHLSLDVPSYRLDEEYTTSIDKQTIKIKDLSFDLLGKKPMFGFDAQNNDDSSSKLHNDKDLKRWKDGVMSKYGNVDVKIDLDASDEIQVMDKQFQDDKESYTQRKGRALKDMGTNV
jgi:hypothetical protein